jgi:hypothetical protein
MRVLFIPIIIATLSAAACIQAQPPTDTGAPVASSSPSPTAPSANPAPATPQALAYTPDLEPIFQSDCVSCHGGFRVYAGYSMTSYAQVMRAVRPGDAASPLVVVTQPGGSMYRYWSGDRVSKANMVFQWVVNNGAQAAR